MPVEETHVIQVTNVSPTVTKDQLKSFFSFIGKIEDIKLYPELEAIDVSTRVCYVKYKDSEDVCIALHLTNTVFVDRALIVVAVSDDKIPDELTALGLGGSEGANPSNMYQGLAQYPVLPANTDLSKVEEIRRTIYASNIDSSLSPEIMMPFFTQAGEIKYMRMAGDEGLSLRNAFIEYTDQNSVIKALGLNGQTLAGHQIRITPSNNAIVKPPIMPGVTASTKDIEEAMKKVNEAESMISAAADTVTNGSGRSNHGSRSRRSRSRTSRSRGSPPRRRSRSRSRRPRYRSRSRRRSRSHKRSRESRSRRSRSRNSRSRSRDKKTRDRRSSRSRRSSREKPSSDLKSKKAAPSVDASLLSKLDREGSDHSRESRSRTLKKKSSKIKSDSVSRRSRSRSGSRKAKKSRREDRSNDKKSQKSEKDARKHKADNEKQSVKESSSKRKNKVDGRPSIDDDCIAMDDKITGTKESGSKKNHKDSNCSQLDMEIDSS